MKLYPKCFIGKHPFINFQGFVHPCCWFPYVDKIPGASRNRIENVFNNPNFNIKNRSYFEIVTSDEWQLALESLLVHTPMACKNLCGIWTNDLLLTPDTYVAGLNNKIKPPTATEFDRNRIDTININELQIETTSRCTLQCQYCWRTKYKGSYKVEDLDLEYLKDAFTMRKWNKIVDCGNYGDPIFYPQFHEMLQFFIDNDCTKEYVAAIAATGRNEKWWDKTIELSTQKVRCTFVFGVDGLEDTSKLHRKNQNWLEITNAMKKCKKAGINVVWQYIPFSFNEHQIETAKQLAKEWNIKFYLMPSSRFNDPTDSFIPKNPKYSYKLYNK